MRTTHTTEAGTVLTTIVLNEDQMAVLRSCLRLVDEMAGTSGFAPTLGEEHTEENEERLDAAFASLSGAVL
jgi:hypothetical protein